MSTIFDYLDHVTYDSIYDRPFKELDVLALTELTYLPFDRIVPQGDTTNIEVRLSDATDLVDRTTDFIVTDQHLQLVDSLATSKRFKNIKLLNYVDEYDPDVQKQFAAMTYRLTMDVYLVVFRGTDDTLIGWKEDFHMTYMDHIPAQRRAASYLQHVMKEFPKGRFMVAGHSKGGNLAAYACSYLPDQLFKQVDAIYCYDSPGLNKSIIKTEGYQRIAHLIHRFVPQGSIVGMMLEVPEPATIVKSRAFGGFAQHDTFTWMVEKDGFVTLDQTSPDSQQMDQTLKQWVQEVPDSQLKKFFDTFFGLFLDAGITSINDLMNLKNFSKIKDIFQNAQDLDPTEREMLERLAKQLIDTRVQAWKKWQTVPRILVQMAAFFKRKQAVETTSPLLLEHKE
ncbi:DUF2974 domain-containing protein [Streptococcus australis]|uniref:DUF2974 domain-containing protein n=1 Tax=Streptococcus australis TaxID=113107 RepID=UPI00232DEB36|nr:DUF2974 domain-containing protein [Streptococcus australis]MDB8642197.1 DUF2974 domain-containing protein [Streptococcus australis]MDB8646121.1 DUF2974 domain-containing protein [Streptococcus australis]